MNTVKISGILMVVALALMSGQAYGLLLKFDFEPSGVTPETGYTHVDETTTYSAGLGYGVFSRPSASGSITATDRGAVSPLGQYKDFVSMGNWRRFLADVPNGDYFVTVVTGDPSNSNQERIVIGNTNGGNTIVNSETYGAVDDGSVVSVVPSGAPVFIRQHSTFTSDLEQIAIPSGSIWRTDTSKMVRILGYNTGSFTDEDTKKMEYLTVDQVVVTVTNGQLFVENQWGAGNYLNFVEIQTVPEPATVTLLGLGSLLLARRRKK